MIQFIVILFFLLMMISQIRKKNYEIDCKYNIEYQIFYKIRTAT